MIKREEKHSLQGQPLLQFNQAVRSVFHQYTTFKGRARRSEFWWFVLFEFIVCFIASSLDAVIINFIYKKFGFLYKGSVGILTLIVFLGLLLPGLAVLWRRLHDTGRSGWYYLMIFVPVILSTVLSFFSTVGSIFFGVLGLVCGVILLAFCCLDSQPGENKYGSSPKYIHSEIDS